MRFERGAYVAMRLTHHIPTAPVITADPAEWTFSALCAQIDPELFFPGDGQNARPAKKICAACPVRDPCLVYGMDDPHGVYGGLSAIERRRLRRANGRPCPHCGVWFVRLDLHVRGCYRNAA